MFLTQISTCLLLVWVIIACAPEFGPWQTDVPNEAKGINARNISALEQLNLKLPYTVGIVGDPQGTPYDFGESLKAINRSRADFVVLVGDLTNFSLKDEFIAVYEEMKHAKKPILTAIGNHDGIAFGREIYAKMWGDYDYTVRVDGIKFLLWNDCKLEFGNNNLDWLEAEIEDDSVVASHIEPAVDVHSQEDIDRWLGFYEKKRVIASLHGHRGTAKSFLSRKNGVPVYVVAKNDGIRYGLVDFDVRKEPRFYSCQDDICVEQIVPSE